MGGGGSTSERAEEKKREAAKRREIREKELKEEHEALMRAEEEEREAASAKRREIREKELKEHNAFIRSLTIPFTMGGADSTSERAEEKREDPSAKRRELEEKELKEHNALMRKHLSDIPREDLRIRDIISWGDFLICNIISRKDLRNYEPGPFFHRAEEKREDPSAKRHEIRELLEEHNALMREHLGNFEHGPFVPWTEEEKREDPPTTRREIRKLLEEHNALMRKDLDVFILREHIRHIFRAEEEREDPSAKRREIREKEIKEHHALMRGYLCDFTLRPESMRPMQSDRPMEIPPPVKLPDPPSMQIVSPLKPRPNILLRAMEKREDPSAMRREIMELLGEHKALVGEDLWNYEHGPISRREHLWPYEPGSISLRPFSIPEKIRAGSPASSSESTMSNRSMTLPVSVKRTEEEKREDPSAKRPEIRELLEEHQALMRKHLWNYEHGPISHRSKSCPEKMRAASPASSCGSMRNARSMGFLVSFKRDEEEKREDPSAKRPEIRKLKLEEDRVVLIRECLSPFEPRPNIPLRQDFWPHDRGPNISSHVLRRKEQFLLHRAMVHDE